jgi:hypothetical protein
MKYTTLLLVTITIIIILLPKKWRPILERECIMRSQIQWKIRSREVISMRLAAEAEEEAETEAEKIHARLQMGGKIASKRA